MDLQRIFVFIDLTFKIHLENIQYHSYYLNKIYGQYKTSSYECFENFDYVMKVRIITMTFEKKPCRGNTQVMLYL